MWAVPGYAHSPYSPQTKSIGLPYRLQTKTSMCTRFPAIFNWSFERGLQTPNLREEETVMDWERALMNSYRPSIVTFPLSSRVSEILPLLCSNTPRFPHSTTSLPKFPHVPLGYEERRCCANCPCS